MVNDLMTDTDESLRNFFLTSLLELPAESFRELETFLKKLSRDGD